MQPAAKVRGRGHGPKYCSSGFFFVQVIQRNATCSCFRMAKINAAQVS